MSNVEVKVDNSKAVSSSREDDDDDHGEGSIDKNKINWSDSDYEPCGSPLGQRNVHLSPQRPSTNSDNSDTTAVSPPGQRNVHLPPERPSTNSDNSDNTAVVAQGWTRRIAEHMNRIRRQSDTRARMHALAGHHFRSLHLRVAVPAAVIPAICAPVVALLGSMSSVNKCADNQVIAPDAILGTVSLAITSALAVVSNTFAYGERSRSHHTFASHYADIVTTISAEMARSRKFRRNVDQFLVETQLRFDLYTATEPVVPRHIETRVIEQQTDNDHSITTRRVRDKKLELLWKKSTFEPRCVQIYK